MTCQRMLVTAVLIVLVACIVAGNGKQKQKSFINKMIRQSARYATAAQQDESPLVAVLHANYSAAYFYALVDIATYDEIHNATGIDVKKFKEHLVRVQDETTRKIVEACPQFNGQVDLFLATIGGEA